MLLPAPDGAEKIKFTFEDDDAKEYAGSFSFSEGEDYIKIGGAKYESSNLFARKPLERVAFSFAAGNPSVFRTFFLLNI